MERYVNADWKDFEGFVEDLIKELHKFKLYVYYDPVLEGSDTIGVIISDKKISKKDLKQRLNEWLEED